MLLKPFRIHNLHPIKFEITAPKYDTIITSEPDAALTYVDDDDGETITVGSSFELQQRLDEPVICHKKTCRRTWYCDCKSHWHTFHLRRHTSQTVNLWEAVGSLASDLPVDKENELNETIISDLGVNPAEPPRDASLDKSPGTSSDTSIHVDRKNTSTDKVFANIIKELDAVAVADVLQNASASLLEAAEATRNADITVINDIFSGFKDIFTEVASVGKMMLSVLDVEATAFAKEVRPLLEEAQKQFNPKPPSVEQDTSIEKDERSERIAASEAGSQAAPPVETHSRPNPIRLVPPQFLSAVYSQPEPTLKQDLRAMPQKRSFTLVPEISLPDRPSTQSLWKSVDGPECEECVEYARRAALVKKQVEFDTDPSTVDPSKTAEAAAVDSSTAILDLESFDPDFAARYPPLKSLQRAKTFSALNERVVSPGSNSFFMDPAISRFPTIVQFERDTRRANGNGEGGPTTAYDHLLTRSERANVERITTESRMAEATPSHVSHAFTADTLTRGEQLNSPHSYTTQKSVDPKEAMGEEPRQQHSGIARRIDRPLSESLETPAPWWQTILNSQQRDPATRPLPGAWPETRTETCGPGLPVANESSGAFFDRMTRGQLNVPTFQMLTPLFPTAQVSVGRSQTVSGSNPASRLTRPFDPMSGSHWEARQSSEQQPPQIVNELKELLAESRGLEEERAEERKMANKKRLYKLLEERKKRSGQSEVMAEQDRMLYARIIAPTGSIRAGLMVEDAQSDSPEIRARQEQRKALEELNRQQIAATHGEGTTGVEEADKRQELLEESLNHLSEHNASLYKAEGRPTEEGAKSSRKQMESAPWPSEMPQRSFTERHRGPRRTGAAAFAHEYRPLWDWSNVGSGEEVGEQRRDRRGANHIYYDRAARRSQSPQGRQARRMRSAPRLHEHHRLERRALPQLDPAVESCEQQLRYMGFGKDDPHEAARLSVYAGAAGGNVFEAVEMIEEDRSAGKRLAQVGIGEGETGWNLF